MKNKIFYLLVIFVFLIGFLTRFIALNKLPNGLDQDESAIGYNAYLINTTGRDEWGIKYPLYFKSFGDYKLPVYIYTVAIFERFLGVNVWSVRLPSALAGFLSVIILFLLVKKLTNDKWLALSSSFLLAINPWSVFLSRAAFETNLATFLILLGFYFYEIYKEKYNIFLGILSLLFFALSMYTYNITRIVAPLIFFSILIFDFLKNKKKNLFKTIFLLILLLIFSLPFLVTLLHASGLSGDSSVLILGGGSKANILEFRSYLIGLPNIFSKIFFNFPVIFLIKYISNLFAFFNINWLFIMGDTGMSGIGNSGQFYLFQLPLLVLGIIYYLKNKNTKNLNGLIIWFLVALIIISLSAQTPHGTRDFVTIIPLTIFSALGLNHLFNYFLKFKNKFLNYYLYFISILIISYSFLFFIISYTFVFPSSYAFTWRSEDSALSLYLKESEAKYKNIYIKDDSNFIYTSLVFYQKYDPNKYLKNSSYYSNGLLLNVKKLDKYNFGDYTLENLEGKGKNLLITNGDYSKPGFSPIKTFYYPTVPKVLFSNGNYYNLPVSPIAYKVYELH